MSGAAPRGRTAAETTALRRMHMRSWRRGTKEMDLILGPYSETVLPDLDDAMRNHYEELLSQNDQDLYSWITGVESPPLGLRAIVRSVQGFHGIRWGHRGNTL